MNDDKNLIGIAKFDSETEAKILQIALIDRGVKAIISGDISAFGPIAGGATGVSVLVRQIEAAEAISIIKEMAAEEPLPEWICDCGATVDEGHAICWKCGCDFPAEQNESPGY